MEELLDAPQRTGVLVVEAGDAGGALASPFSAAVEPVASSLIFRPPPSNDGPLWRFALSSGPQ